MPALSRYFDYAATAPVRKEALETMMSYMNVDFGNPSSLHQFGYRAKAALDSAREIIARTIAASAKEIIFTASGTESDNLAVLGGARRMRRLGKGNHVIISAVEHPAVREACQALTKEGFQITVLPVDGEARVNPEDVRRALRADTVLISVMHANNVVGTIQPLEEIGAIIRQHRPGILLHSDAVQSFGKIPIDVTCLQVDLLTVSAHKIGGPKGIAALFVRKGTRVDPLVYGGGQERGLRAATENVPAIIAFAKAAELAITEQEKEMQRMRTLRDRFLHRLTAKIPGFRTNGHEAECLPSHINISIERIEGQALMLELDRLGFATSSGSACSSTDSEPSYVLLAMGRSREAALESLRITMGRHTTEQSVDKLAEALENIVANWRRSINVPPVGTVR